MQNRYSERIIFVRSDGYRERRLSPHQNDVCRAARDAKARFFIWAENGGWAILDMRTAQQNTPTPGAWSINDPVRWFEHDQLDAAIMWALAMASKP